MALPVWTVRVVVNSMKWKVQLYEVESEMQEGVIALKNGEI